MSEFITLVCGSFGLASLIVAIMYLVKYIKQMKEEKE